MEILSKNKIAYVLFHLQQHVEFPQNFYSDFHYLSAEEYKQKKIKEKIIFIADSSSLNLKKIQYFEEIPILFPNRRNSNEIFFIDNNSNLCIECDLLKSAFYLLSAYQETLDYEGDKYGRFPFEQSIQNKLNGIKKPIVNYYFSWIIKALQTFYKLKNQPLSLKNTQARFILTHDIDSIDKYDVFFVGDKLKQLLRISKPKVAFIQAVKEFYDAMVNFLKFIKKPNPYWNFQFLINNAPKNTFRHIFFFLEKDQLHKDSYYKFSQKRVKKLFAFLKQKNCEIGIHGTQASHNSVKKMQETIAHLEENTGFKITANRQHCLKYKMPTTALIHQECGLQEDFTLGFAAHEGFRNAYCHRFKLYDFDKDRMIDVWQYPLNVMDGTLFGYRNLTFEQAELSVNELFKEVVRFGGNFTLLWHNSFLDEKVMPGITDFYLKIIKKVDLFFRENAK